MPLVSVIMLSYNHKDYIVYAINSVLNQSFQDWELIIIDDASADGSQQLIKSFSERDERISVICHEINRGIAASTNEGIDIARGKFIAFLDSDDMWTSDKLTAQVTLLKENDDLVVWSEGDLIDESGSFMGQKFTEIYGAKNKKKSGDIFQPLIEGNYIFQSSIIMKTENLKGIRFNEGLKYLNDYQFVVELAKRYKFKFIDKSLAMYRAHPCNTIKHDPEGFVSDEIKLRTHFIANYSRDVSGEVILSNHARIVDILNKKIFDLENQLLSTENELFEMKRSMIWQLLMLYHNNILDRFLPTSSNRRYAYNLAFEGSRILVNDGIFEFGNEFCAYFQNKIRNIYKKDLSVVMIIDSFFKKKVTNLEQQIKKERMNVEYIILNYTDEIYYSNKFKIIKNNRELRLSDALNEAIRICSGKYILFINNEEVLDRGSFRNLMNGFFQKIADHNKPNLEKFYKLSDILFVEKNWLERIGGFDDQFRKGPYINNNLNFCATNLVYKADVLSQACTLFGASSEKIKCLKKSANAIYEFQSNNECCILRLIERPLEFVPLVKGEINWINYLGDNGIIVCRAVQSAKGNYVEAIKVPDSCYLVSSFEKSKGCHIDLKNPCEWNDILFQKWGSTLGKMHSLSKSYTIKEKSTKRNNWNRGTIFSPYLKLGTGENKVLKIWRSILFELESLPVDKNSYGLVHNDFHYRNFLIDGSKIVVIDFDDCAFNWFACDMAISLYDAISVLPINIKNEYEILLIKNFLKGYERENVLDEYWLKLLPKFLKFRQIYSYLFNCTEWNLNTLDDGQKEYLTTLKRLIENDIPCINANISDLLSLG